MNGGQTQTQPGGGRHFTERVGGSASFARRSRIALVAATLAWPMIMSGNAAAQQAAPRDIGSCPADQMDQTITLTDDCDTDATLMVPDGYTLDGAGHTITAHAPLTGAVVQNAGSEMHLRNLTVVGNPDGTAVDYGVVFDDAGGSMDNVTVKDVTQHSTILTGRAIWIEAPAGSDRTVDMTRVIVTGFQRTGLGAYGGVTVNVSNSTFGPPDTTMNSPDTPLNNIGQNTVQYGGGAGGTFTGNTVIGSTAGRPDATSAGLLVYGAADLTVSDNTFGGAGLDVGINVIQWAGTPSTGITIENNTFNREPPPAGFANYWGRGVSVDQASSEETTLVGNIFNEGWQEDLFGPVTQPPVITTTSLPDGTVGEPYSEALEGATTNPEPGLTWSVVGGELPPGLTFNPDGTITGTPTEDGPFTFTAEVTDAAGLSSTRDFTITVLPPGVTPPPPPPPGPGNVNNNTNHQHQSQSQSLTVIIGGRVYRIHRHHGRMKQVTRFAPAAPVAPSSGGLPVTG
jgi:hypothetical protein